MLIGCCALQVCQELAQRILPGMMLMSPDTFLAHEAWSLLQLLPYSIRYEVYESLTVRWTSHRVTSAPLHLQVPPVDTE